MVVRRYRFGPGLGRNTQLRAWREAMRLLSSTWGTTTSSANPVAVVEEGAHPVPADPAAFPTIKPVQADRVIEVRACSATADVVDTALRRVLTFAGASIAECPTGDGVIAIELRRR